MKFSEGFNFFEGREGERTIQSVYSAAAHAMRLQHRENQHGAPLHPHLCASAQRAVPQAGGVCGCDEGECSMTWLLSSYLGLAGMGWLLYLLL